MALNTSPTNGDPGDWADQISFRPTSAVQERLAKSNIFVQKIETAAGILNLDMYKLRIRRLPQLNGSAASPESLLEHIRTHLDDFFDSSLVSWTPLVGGSLPSYRRGELGAVVHIDMRVMGLNPEDGSVTLSDRSTRHWAFSTVWTPTDLCHPVSGTRTFGVFRYGDDHILYTRGTDRPARLVDNITSAFILSGGDRIWRSFLQQLENFVRKHGGDAMAIIPNRSLISAPSEPPNPLRVTWAIGSRLHDPQVQWRYARPICL